MCPGDVIFSTQWLSDVQIVEELTSASNSLGDFEPVINSLRPSDTYMSCVSKIIIIGPDNGLSPTHRQAYWYIVNSNIRNKLQ